jgi:rare lipoprotein A
LARPAIWDESVMSKAGAGMRAGWAMMAIAVLSACGGGNYRPVRDMPVKIGPPYKVRGVTYTPAADPAYDMLGYASWYGSESGNRTANGERFRAKWVTAAHVSLPLPSYVEVTALETGRTILVRINDRGPFAGRGRIIDLSRGAAEELGIRAQGHAPVRVRIVNPPEKDRASLRKGKPARVRPSLSAGALANLRAQLPASGQ